MKAKIIKELFGANVNGNDYKLTEFKIRKMKQVSVPNINLDNLKKNWKFVTSTEVVNCTGDLIKKTISISGTTTTSTTITREIGFSYSYSGTVGVNIEIFSASVTQTLTASFSQSNSETKTKSITASDSTELDFDKKGGRVVILECKHLEGKVPYQVTFEPSDDGIVSITFKGKNGYVRIFEHVNYNGVSKRVNMGNEIPKLDKNINNKLSSIKVNGGVFAILYKHKNFRGKSLFVYNSRNWIEKEFNDKISSIKVMKRVFSAPSIKFRKIKNFIPLQIKRFTSTGYLELDYVSQVPSTRVIILEMEENYFNELCNTPFPSTANKSNKKSINDKIKTRKLTKEMLFELIKNRKLKNSEKYLNKIKQ